MAKGGGEKAELVFIPFPFMGHLPPAVETARKLAGRCPDRISRITILITKFLAPDDKLDSFIQSLNNLPDEDEDDDDGHISFIALPDLDNPPELYSKYFLIEFAEAYKPIVKQTLQHRFRGKGLVGLVIDPCYAAMVDVAEELSVPSYIFFASGAAFLRMSFHFASYGVPDDENRSVLALELNLKGFRNPVPATVWPDMFLDKDSGWVEVVLDLGRKIGRSKGTLINTFNELEPDLIRSCTLPLPKPNQYADGDDDLVPYSVYPVGPIVNLNIDSFNDRSEESSIMSWLTSQPSCSVVFLCFGSRGTFNENQVKEIAEALERSGQRFLWSLRLKPSDSAGSGSGSGSGRNGGLIFKSPEEYDSFREILPEGFLDRSTGIGRVIGWAPQASVLGHRAVGAFVSHCGWNSVMESVWFGVPLVAWPMYGEQQLNAFALVKELGIAVEIKMDYKCNDAAASNGGVVRAEVIERAIRKVMEGDEEGKGLRERTKQMSEMGKKSLEIGGSSYESMGRFVEDVFTNLKS